MYATRIDEHLSSYQLHQALIALQVAFERYIELSISTVAMFGSSDGFSHQQTMLPSIMQRPGTCSFYDKLVGDRQYKDGYLLPLGCLGLDVDCMITKNPCRIQPTSGSKMLPLTPNVLLFGRFFTAKPISPDGIPLQHLRGFIPIEELSELSISWENKIVLPAGHMVIPEVFVTPDAYRAWLGTARQIVEYRLTPLQPLLPSPILLPPNQFGVGSDMLTFGNFGEIRIPWRRLEQKPQIELPAFEPLFEIVRKYRNSALSSFELIQQEVIRREANEGCQPSEYTLSELIAKVYAETGYKYSQQTARRRIEAGGILPIDNRGGKRGAAIYPASALDVLLKAAENDKMLIVSEKS